MSPEQDDLDWLATRYALGETDAVETNRCEDLLQESQPFREAVARSVELLSAASSALVQQPTKTLAAASRRPLVFFQGIAIGVAASFIVTASLISAGWLSPRVYVPSAPATTLVESVDRDVALQWVNHLQQDTETSTSTESAESPSAAMDGTASVDWMNAVAELPAEGGE